MASLNLKTGTTIVNMQYNRKPVSLIENHTLGKVLTVVGVMFSDE